MSALNLALDLYIYRLRAFLGSMIAALEGIDVLTFAGGVGEHVPLIRSRLCQSFRFLGLAVDEDKKCRRIQRSGYHSGKLDSARAGCPYRGRLGNSAFLLANYHRYAGEWRQSPCLSE